MDILDRIKKLCKQHDINVYQLEEALGFGRNTIYQWNKRTPGVDKLEAVANYFNVSTDYLLGRTDKEHYYDLTDKDERDIQKRLEKMIEDLSQGGALAFSKDEPEIDKETRELLIVSLENSLRIAKIEAKKRFTPKKYRN